MTAQLIKTSDIQIDQNRQRREFESQALQELAAGIRARGLMHAVVLRERDGAMVLVAGERRMRAIDEVRMLGGQIKYNGEVIPDGFLPYVTLGQLSPLEAEEAELEENLHRKDLTWQERAAALSRLHNLRSKQAHAEGRVHTVADTAVEVKGRSDGNFQNTVRKDIIVSQYLHIPEIAKAKNTDEAFKILKKQEETKKYAALAARVGSTLSHESHKAFNTNCLSWMLSSDPEQFDVILTDPPYGMGADEFGDGAGKLGGIEHHYKDDYESWRALMQDWAPLAYRVAKPEAHAYVFCDIDNFHELKRIMQSAGWWVTRTPFICTKPNSGRVPHPENGPRRQWEMILYAIKGKKKTLGIFPDVITTFADANTTHGAQKPVALYSDLLKRSCRPGDRVLDSFAGSGTIFPAAHAAKVLATGLEQNKEYFGMCLSRLQGLTNADPAEQGKNLMAELNNLKG
jgi:site-specific DNA-methyltransferase (adenine-specific)